MNYVRNFTDVDDKVRIHTYFVMPHSMPSCFRQWFSNLIGL